MGSSRSRGREEARPSLQIKSHFIFDTQENLGFQRIFVLTHLRGARAWPAVGTISVVTVAPGTG